MLQKPDLKVNTQLCLKLADFVESLPNREPNLFGQPYEPVFAPNRPNYFSMRVFHRREDCGTIACLCGSLAYLVADEGKGIIDDGGFESFDEAGKLLGINLIQAKQLFAPPGWPASNVTSQEAAKVVRHLAITGEVNWDILKKDEGDGREQDSNSV